MDSRNAIVMGVGRGERAGQPEAVMTVLDVRFSDWIERGFQLFVAHAVVLLLAGLAAVALSVVSLGLLSGPMLAGLALMILNLMDERLARPTLNDLFRGFDYFKETLPVTLGFYGLAFAALLLNFIPVVGTLLNAILISVGMATGVLAIFHVVARRVAPQVSARVLLDLFKVNWGPLLGFYLLATLIGGLGALACGVGLIVTVPLYVCIIGAAYVSIAAQSVEL
ncbi:MAG TPA: hypothetical protein PKE26_05405 [Kiritimatiellia bacterium]|nr:hypothetical protein [Kiritimatiellia bacterium]HMO98530.1 hypothetical protein [Kiritimatiellia bacterium]